MKNFTVRSLFLPLLIVAALVASGCDSGDPVDELGPEDVAGTYTANQFLFNPEASALSNVNVTTRLEPNTLKLRLFGDGQYTLEYQFKGGPLSLASGNFRVSGSEITIESDRSDRDRHARLLLSNETTFVRAVGSTTTLTAAVEKSVNLEEFDSAFAGLDSVPGALQIQLVLQR